MLSALTTAIKSGVGRQILTLQKNSPNLLFVTGAVGIVASGVLACRATLKVHEVLENAENDRDLAHQTLESGRKDYSEKDYKKDLQKIRLTAAIGVAKLYAPSIGLAVAGMAALTGSHVVLSRRNVGLTAAYATLDRAYREYRERVAEVVGEDREKELYRGLEEREVYAEDENGPTTKFIKGVGPRGNRSPYAVIFDESNSLWKPSADMNEYILENVEKFANQKLRENGVLFLNEVHDLLCLPRTKEGQVVGWVLNGEGDSRVDMGLKGQHGGPLFLTGGETGVWLDFNVDGVVYDKLPSNFKDFGKKKRKDS